MGKVSKNKHAQYLYGVGTWANINLLFLQLLPLSFQIASRMQLLALLQNQFPSCKPDPAKLFSDLLSLANTSWNKEPYGTTFAPLLQAIQLFQENKKQHRQKHNLLAYNLYLSLPPKQRDEQFLTNLQSHTLAKLSKPEIYPTPNHWIYESGEIRALWEQHLLHGKQPDSRLKRHPLLMLEENRLQLDIAGSQSAIIKDQDTGEIVAMVYRNFMPEQYQSILEWVNRTILASIERKKSARLEDPGKIVQAGYSAGSRSHPRFDWAKNLLSKRHNPEELQETEYLESSVFALFWNMARRLIHSDIKEDIEGFLRTGIPRMDSRGKQRGYNTYTIQYEGGMYEFQQGELAPPVGFFASNYSRAIHKEGGPHKYSIFWTTERSLREDEGGNFFIANYGVRIQGARNTMVVWQTKMFHGTSLAKLDSTGSGTQGKGQAGLSIVSPNRLPTIWKKYMEEKIDEKDLEDELEMEEEEWEQDM